MAEAKDPAIKLFGKTIPLPDVVVVENELTSPGGVDDNVSPIDDDMSCDLSAPCETRNNDKDKQDENSCYIEESGIPPQAPDKSACQDPSLTMAENPDTLSGGDDEKSGAEPSKSDEEKMGNSVSEEKTLKKPDKILPCPRCNSMDTKFCYYNNYNVNQPRHFCRNCQRYWTAGGSMRNVPIGAGRRKNKSSSASHYRHLTVPETLACTRPDIPIGGHPGLQPNGTVLTFGSDSPLCESMTSILNLAEQTRKPEENGSNLEDATKTLPKEPSPPNCLPYPTQIPWPYPWNPAQWNPSVPSPLICPNGLALAYYPPPAYLAIPWVAQPFPGAHLGLSSGPNSPTLGKHTRDGKILTPTSSEDQESENTSGERSLWVPKTLRIDDPGEAAKSSIWTTLGIKHIEKPESIGRGSGLFKAFQSKCEERTTPNLGTSTVLDANPAALSRSQNFQENS